jgi:hypothetical protein
LTTGEKMDTMRQLSFLKGDDKPFDLNVLIRSNDTLNTGNQRLRPKNETIKINGLIFSSLNELKLIYSLNFFSNRNIILFGISILKIHSMMTTLSTNLLNLTRAVESNLVRLSIRLPRLPYMIYRREDNG